jgi:hypothetical protein
VTVKFATAIYVLHAFQKKSKVGIKTPTEDLEFIRQRLKAAEADYKDRLGKENVIMSKDTKDTKDTVAVRGTDNVFADLGTPMPTRTC